MEKMQKLEAWIPHQLNPNNNIQPVTQSSTPTSVFLDIAKEMLSATIEARIASFENNYICQVELERLHQFPATFGRCDSARSNKIIR